MKTLTNSTATSNLEAALDLAARGFPVFPLQPRSKEPYKGSRGFLDATTDVKIIRAWWSHAPESNVGLRPPPTVLVVDVDPRNGGLERLAALESEGKPLPNTATVRTGGGGLHAYYDVPAGLSWPKELAPGIDLKSASGYLVAPPSVHESGRVYAWDASGPIAPAPAWLVALGRERQAATEVVDEDEGAAQPDEVIERVAAQLEPHYVRPHKHAIAYAFGGWARQRGWNSADAVRVVERLPTDNPRGRAKDVRDGYKANQGWHALRDALGEEAATALDASTPNPRREREAAGIAAAGALIPPQAPAPAKPANSNGQGDKPKRRAVTTAMAVDILSAGEWLGVLAFDALAARVVCLREPPMRPQDNPGAPCAGEWTDAHTARARTWICKEAGAEPSKDATDAAVEIVARCQTFHPVQAYLAGLRWDGLPRLDGLLPTYFGADANEYTRRVGAKTLIAAVARARQPGCKVDTMTILEGAQGIGKSRSLRALAPRDEWFADTPLDLESKDAAQCLQGKWIYEIGELHSFNRTETTRIKAFVSSQSDNLRPSYGRRNQDFPRQCVFIGTTNGSEYLTDTTGNRRYWPVRCRAIDVAGIQRDRDQLWAEAAARYSAGERWWLEGAEAALAEAQQADREAIDPWEQPLAAWTEARSGAPFSMTEVLTSALTLGRSEQHQANATRVGKLLARLGWRSKKVKLSGTNNTTRVYVREER